MSVFLKVSALAAVALGAALVACSPNPAPAPAAAAPPAPPTPTHGPVEIEVPLEEDGGTFLVPATINGGVQVKATLDSGASDVVIPADVAERLAHSGTLAESDYVGSRMYVLADGSHVPSRVVNLRSLKVGTLELGNVRAALGGPGSSLLLGQSFLSRLTNWSIDNRRHVLLIRDTLDAHDRIAAPQTPPGVAPPTTTLLDSHGNKIPASENDPKHFGPDNGSDRGGDRGGDDGDDDERPAKPGYGRGAPDSDHKHF